MQKLKTKKQIKRQPSLNLFDLFLVVELLKKIRTIRNGRLLMF